MIMTKSIAIKGDPMSGHLVIEILKKMGRIGSYCEFPYKSSGLAFFLRKSDNRIVCENVENLSSEEYEIHTFDSFKEKYM